MDLFYRSTRSKGEVVRASQAILKGLAEDGGLYVPESVPILDKSLEELSKMNYQETAYEVMKLFFTDFTEEELKDIIQQLANSKEYGEILRAKGIVAADEGEWFHFDLVPEETEIRRGAADFTGRICVIGSALDEAKVKELFYVA